MLRHVLLLSGWCVATACGRTAASMADEAMEACIVARNPVFKSGNGANALATALPPNAEALATRLNYSTGFKLFSAIAEVAGNQVTLVCALDLVSRNSDPEVTRFIKKYVQHPSPDVALAARALYDKRPPLAN